MTIIIYLYLVFAELSKLEVRVVLEYPADGPLARKEEKILASEVCNALGIVRELQGLGIKPLILYPADLLIREVGTTKITAVLTLESMLKNLELKHADNTDDNSLKTGVRLEEYLHIPVQ